MGHQETRTRRALKREILLLAVLVFAPYSTPGQARLESPRFDPQTGATFNILPPMDKAHRIDFTRDLRDLDPLDVLPPASPARLITDRTATNEVKRFYRSVEVEPVVSIFSYDPDPVTVGSVLRIKGQFFSATPGANRVTIAGAEARVLT